MNYLAKYVLIVYKVFEILFYYCNPSNKKLKHINIYIYIHIYKLKI